MVLEYANATGTDFHICKGLVYETTVHGGTDVKTYVITEKEITDLSMSLSPGSDYYLDTTDGQIISSPPTANGCYVQKIGYATGVHSLFINLERPIKRRAV